MIWRKDKNKIGIENPELGNLKITGKWKKRVVLRVIGSIAEECER